MPNRLRITAIPPGEAPESVRRAWIGLELPLAGSTAGPRDVHATGVLTGARGFLRTLLGLASGRVRETTGYVVTVQDAMELLAAKDPDAAAWWRAHVPHLFTGKRVLVFAVGCGELIGADGAVVRHPREEELRPRPLAPLLRGLIPMLAIDGGIPWGWSAGLLNPHSPRLWVVLVVSAFSTLMIALLILARLRARQEDVLERQR
jgi:hypothetical protein